MAAPQKTPTRRRSLSAIRADLAGLSDAHRDAVYEFLAARVLADGVVVPRFLTCTGLNGGAIFALDSLARRPKRPPAARARLSLEIAALWCQDNPDDFMRPSWCPELEVSGTVDL